MKRTLELFTPLLYLIALTTVVLTAHISGYENFLKTMTQENGLFETVSVSLRTYQRTPSEQGGVVREPL